RQSRASFVNHVADFVVEHKDFKDAHPAFVTSAATLLATFTLHDVHVAQLTGLDSQCAHFAFAQFRGLPAIRTDSPNESLRHDRAQGRSDEERLHADVDQT